MKRLFRKSAAVPTRRQRLQADDSLKKSASFSYHARRSDIELNVGRQEQREPSSRLKDSGRFGNFWLNRFGAVILLIALVISAVNVLSLSNSVKIMPLANDASTPLLHDTATYEAAAQKILEGSVLNRNKLTLDSAKLSRDLKKQFPELSTTSVTVPLLAHRPIVYIQTARPALVLAASNGSFVLSNTGRALVPSTQLPTLSSLDLPLVGDQSGISVAVGKQILTSENVNFIEVIAAQLAAKNIPTAAMTLPAAASQLDVQLTGKPYFIKFNLQSNSARQQVGTFLATKAQLEKQNIAPGKYIDVRVDGRAYYQ
ncbi:MAG: hypothetical protein JWO35_327 [Candidatus Saccharibacteria bacterium]|nr:hypothetical protein [Candidatus Saccharibacteria bacterium]